MTHHLFTAVKVLLLLLLLQPNVLSWTLLPLLCDATAANNSVQQPWQEQTGRGLVNLHRLNQQWYIMPRWDKATASSCKPYRLLLYFRSQCLLVLAFAKCFVNAAVIPPFAQTEAQRSLAAAALSPAALP
jgi:hypothetical protein